MPVPGYEGFAALGETLAGGNNTRRQSNYITGLREGATAQESLAKARIARAQANARDALAEAIQKSGIQRPELATAILGMSTGQPNLSTYTGGLKDLGDIELERQQADAFKAGDYALGNQLGAVKADKVYEPVRAVDGNLIPSGVTLGDPEFSVKPLPQTTARIGVLGAQKEKALRPPAPRASGAGKVPSVEDAELANARAALQQGAKREAVIGMLRSRGFGSLIKKL